MVKSLLDFFYNKGGKRVREQAKKMMLSGIESGKNEWNKVLQQRKEERLRREREQAYEEAYEAEFRYRDHDLDFSMLITEEEAYIYEKARRKLKEVKWLQSDSRVHQQWEAKKYLSLHDHFSDQIAHYFPQRLEEPLALHRAIRYCERQISYSPVARKAYEKDPYQFDLPIHPGFQHLIQLYEEIEEWEEALKLAQRAQLEGWQGEWKELIRHLEEKVRYPR